MRIEIPVKSITSAILESKSLTRSGNIGAMARGPIACMNVAAVTLVMAENFQKLLQFCATDKVSDCTNNRNFDGSRVYQGVMRIVTRLRNEDSIGRSRRFDEAMVAGAIIDHHFGSGQDLDVELLLQMFPGLNNTVNLRQI
ncbi:MAG: hypothetical protein Q9221_003182 [Calogaya cf. arnoldii]